MKITLIDGLHDSDRGGAGIIEGAITAIRDACPDQTQLNLALVYRTSKNASAASSASRHTRRSFPDLTILYSPYDKLRPKHPLGAGWRALVAFGKSIWHLTIAPWSSHPTIHQLRNSDLVISKGGHFYHSIGMSTWSPAGIIKPYISLYLILLSLRLRKPLALLAHSVGPINNRFSRIFYRLIFRRVRYLSVREEISAQILQDLGLMRSQISVVPDTAFALLKRQMALEEAGVGDLSYKYLVVTPRQWNFPFSRHGDQPEIQYANYLGALATACDLLLQSGDVDQILLVAHNDGAHSEDEQDSKPAEQIYNLITHRSSTRLVTTDLSPQQMLTLYGGSKLLIGTRMHSVIFALVGGAPAVAISYTHKTASIMQGICLGQYQLDIGSIEGKNLFDVCQEALSQRDVVLEQFERNLHDDLERLRSFLQRVIGDAFTGHDVRSLPRNGS